MYPDVLDEHITKCKKATDKPFGVNMALLYPKIEEHINVIINQEEIPDVDKFRTKNKGLEGGS